MAWTVAAATDHGGGSAPPAKAQAACRATPRATYSAGSGTPTGSPSSAGAIVRTAVDTASRAFQSSAEQIARSFGISGEQGDDLARQSSDSLEAITECGAVLARGFQEISRQWMNLAQHRLQKNLEGVQALASCQSVQDVVAVQTG